MPTRPGDDATAVRLLQKRASPVLLIDCCSFPNCGCRKLKGRPHRRASAVICVCVGGGVGILECIDCRPRLPSDITLNGVSLWTKISLSQCFSLEGNFTRNVHASKSLKPFLPHQLPSEVFFEHGQVFDRLLFPKSHVFMS